MSNHLSWGGRFRLSNKEAEELRRQIPSPTDHYTVRGTRIKGKLVDLECDCPEFKDKQDCWHAQKCREKWTKPVQQSFEFPVE